MSATSIIENNKRVLKVIPIKSDEDSRGISRRMPDDLFKNDYGDDIIEPPFDLLSLAVLPESSSILNPCLDAMAINIEGLGHRIIPRDDISEEEHFSSKLKNDISVLKNFFNNASLECTFTKLRDTLRRDLETTGNSYFEVIPSLLDNSVPSGLVHLPSWTMRICKSEDESTYCEVPRIIKNDINGEWEIKNYPYSKYFRRYVQRRDHNSKKVYFKEWGDPRVIDYRTGIVLADSWESASPSDREYATNPVIHSKLYCPRSVYGLPRYVGNFFAIYGNRAADIINYTTLKCNNIPAFVLMATNVQLSDGSINRIRDFVEERIQGDNNYSTFLVLEAEPITEGMKDPGNMKLEMVPLTNTQHTDHMFKDYMTKNDEKIRQAFRLPPIYLGLAEEYNRSTADSSKKLAEEQIFKPERDNIDSIFNNTLVPALGVSTAVFRSNTPNVTDNYELTQLLAVAERSGGLSPAISRLIVEDVLGRDLPDINEEINPDVPFTLTMLREQIKSEQLQITESEKVLSDDDVMKQLRMLKGMMKNSSSLPKEAYNAVDNLIGLLELADYENNNKAISNIGAKKENVEETDKMIREENGQYCVYSENGDRSFGCYDTLEEAKERLAQIEYFSDKSYYDVEMKTIVKSDNSDERIIGGAVLVPGQVDLQGDIYDKQSTKEAAYYWFENYLSDPIDNGIKLMHKGEVIYKEARPVQSYVLDRDVTFKVDVPAVNENHPSKKLTDVTYPEGTWMLFSRIRDDKLWDDIKNGKYLGWSIGGVATVQQLKNNKNSK